MDFGNPKNDSQSDLIMELYDQFIPYGTGTHELPQGRSFCKC